LPPIFEIPQHDMSVTEALKVMPDPEAVVELAERAAGFVPDCSAGMERLISSHTASALAKFHRDFYSTQPDPPESWPCYSSRHSRLSAAKQVGRSVVKLKLNIACRELV
jgi:hypothetical protein